MKKLSEEKKFEIIQALRCGLTGEQIKDQTGVSLSTICKIRKEEEREGFDIWHVGGKLSSFVK